MTKCAIYTRLSKEDEDKQQPESESIQNQKSLLTRYAIDHGWDIYSIFCDESIILGLGQEVLVPQGFPGLLLIFMRPLTSGSRGRMIEKCVEFHHYQSERRRDQDHFCIELGHCPEYWKKARQKVLCKSR